MDRSSDVGLLATATAPGDGEDVRAPASKTLARGASLGRYIVVDTIGVGGTGIVYSAFDPDLDRKVALKLLRKRFGNAARARLLREAQAMAKLSHPNVVTVFEAGTDGQRDFVAMEFIDGQDLAGWSEEERSTDEVLEVYRQAGEGLAAAHRAGLVHRDFKPQNVLVSREGKVLVTDFGLARHESRGEVEGEEAADPKPASTLTRTGALLGTPAYMAPEQHLAEEVGPRSDQFSFCVALYEALCGQRPYEGETYEALKAAVTDGKAAALPDRVAVPAAVRSAIEKGMAREPADRHASMEALLAELTPKPRRWAPAIVGATLAAAVAAVLVVQMGTEKRSEACHFDRSMLAGAWDADVRARVAASFAETGVEGEGQVFSRLASIVDAYGDDIVAMRTEVCETSRGDRPEADEAMLLQVSCLQRRKQELATLTTAFSSVDPRGVDRVIEAASSLRPVSECGDVEALERGVPAPAAEVRAEVEGLQARLKEARLDAEAGHVTPAIESAEGVKTRSLVIGYLPLVAEAFETLGHLYVRTARMREAEKAYEEAILAAEESGYTEYRARALVGMTLLVATGSSRFGEARRLGRRAKAAISQGGGDPDLIADVDLAMANILVQEGDPVEGRKLLSETLRTYRNHPNAKSLFVAKLQNKLAGLQIELGQFDDAHRLALESHESLRAELGASHPRTARALQTLAVTHRMRGELREARDVDRELRAFWNSEKARALLKELDDYTTEVRTVQGRVLDSEGKAVAGAVVVCAQKAVADSRYIDAAWGPKSQAAMHYDREISDADGNFICDRTSREDIVIVAEHERLGRSVGYPLKGSDLPASGIEVTLLRTGFLSGHVTKDGKPAAGAQSVSVVPVHEDLSTPDLAALSFLRSDGTYSFERLAPGRYKVFAVPRTSDATRVLRSREVEIVSGRGVEVDFDLSEGDAALRVVVRGEEGASVPSAQILLVPGHVESQTGKSFNANVVANGVDVRSHFWSEGGPLDVEGLRVGEHSLCVVPLAGDYRDPEYMKTFTKEMLDAIPVHCQDVVFESGKTLDVDVEVPALKPPVVIQPSSKTGG